MREEVRERGDKEAKGGVSKAGIGDSAGWKAGQTHRAAAV